MLGSSYLPSGFPSEITGSGILPRLRESSSLRAPVASALPQLPSLSHSGVLVCWLVCVLNESMSLVGAGQHGSGLALDHQFLTPSLDEGGMQETLQGDKLGSPGAEGAACSTR